MEGVVVLFLLEVLRQTEVAQNVVLFFFYIPKANHTKIVTFRKQFSLSFVNIYSLICLSFGIFPKKEAQFLLN